MKDAYLLVSPALPGVSLRSAVLSDCEDLRTWKNDHRESFFAQDVIAAEGQRRWFDGYRERTDDWMFMVVDGAQSIGCMGFRLREGEADVYNVILGRADRGGRGVMGGALRLMCSYSRECLGCPIVARVLKTNPAIAWYQKNGFDIVAERETHYLIRLAEGRFVPVAFERKDIAQ